MSDAAVPPVAARVEHGEVRHGATVIDPYFWLRDKSNAEVIRYLEAENAYTAAMTADILPFQEALYKEMLGRIKQTDLSVPTRRGRYYYYSRTEEGKQYPIQCRRKGLEAAEEVLLDLNELAQGHAFFSLGDFIVSDDDNLLAYSTDTVGFRQYRLHVKDLGAGRLLADSAERVTSVEWAADSRTLFLTTEDTVTKRSNQMWRHVLGGNAAQLVYEETDELFRIHAERTHDKKFILLRISSTDSGETHYAPAARPGDPFRVFLPRQNKHRYNVDHREGLFYIRTNKDAKNFRIVTAPDEDVSPANWTGFVAHRSDVLIEGMELFRNFAVVSEKREALTRLRVFDFASEQWTEIAFPEPVYAASGGGNPEYDTSLFRYRYQSFITPPSVFEYDMATHQAKLLKQDEVLGGYDPSQYVSERQWATARDGTKVPLSIVYKKGFQRDGTAALFLYAYGSYGFGMPAGFSSARLSLLDRGMVFAIAHIRGGNEMGEPWHDNGMLMNKKNTFYDFIDSAEYLIREKWTSPDRLVIQGSSAGGLLVGAVINMRPELFHAAHAGVPFVDMMNTMLDASLPLTVGEYLEWGNPNERAAYDYMLSYSPYDNLEAKAYPALLVTTSLNDSQVGYWEPAKYVARMRTVKTGAAPLLLKVNMGAGHGGASGRYDRLKELSFEYAWLMSQAGIAVTSLAESSDRADRR